MNPVTNPSTQVSAEEFNAIVDGVKNSAKGIRPLNGYANEVVLSVETVGGDTSTVAIPGATANSAGIMTASDKSKLDAHSAEINNLKEEVGNMHPGTGGASTADAVSYDNSKSALQSTNVQDGLDEVCRLIQQEDPNVHEFVPDNEWVSVTVDANGKIIEGTDRNGMKHFVKQALFETAEDVEGRTEMTVDQDGRIWSYRDKGGVKYEYKQHTEHASFGHMSLSDNNGKEIAEALKRIGFNPGSSSSSSDDEELELPIPRVAAKMRIITPAMPTNKNANIEAEIEFSDKDGNYFRKSVIINSQGDSSLAYIQPDGSQGNVGIDFVDCKIKFGHWVPQDSFHLKKYYIDSFRGQCVVGYHLIEQVYQTRHYGKRYPYETIIEDATATNATGDFRSDFNTGALCHPDGFPVVVYVNTGGEDKLYGVYALCLKKHRDNYYCKKSNTNNIILDGLIRDNTLFGGSVDWSNFEIRNPKDLVDINGKEYDGDNPKELSDSDSKSLAVKRNIERFAGVNSALAASNTKDTFEQYFLVDYFIDYFVTAQVIYHADGFDKNWIWCTWDGTHWAPTVYDTDSIFGSATIGTYITEPTKGLVGGSVASKLEALYSEEIKARYAELRRKGIFSVENIVGLLDSWVKRIGYDNLKNDLELYDQTPSYRNSYISDNWLLEYYTWNDANNNYDNAKTYAEGETCTYKGYKMKAKVSTTGVPPFSQIYDKYPYASGCYNSVSRVKKWLTERIQYLDEVYQYKGDAE